MERILPRERERAGIKRAVGVQIRAHAPEEVEQARLIVADGLLKALVIDPRHELVLVRKVPVKRAAVDLRGRAEVGHGDVRKVTPEHKLLETLGEHFFRCGFAHGAAPLPMLLPPVYRTHGKTATGPAADAAGPAHKEKRREGKE